MFLVGLCSKKQLQLSRSFHAASNNGRLAGQTDHKLYLSGFVQGYGLAFVHTGSLVFEKLAPDKVSTMTVAQEKDYEEKPEVGT